MVAPVKAEKNKFKITDDLEQKYRILKAPLHFISDYQEHLEM